MRALDRKEMRKRGCVYCTDAKKKKRGFGTIHQCPYDECPYHELDEYETYSEYIKSKGDLLFLRTKNEDL